MKNSKMKHGRTAAFRYVACLLLLGMARTAPAGVLILIDDYSAAPGETIDVAVEVSGPDVVQNVALAIAVGDGGPTLGGVESIAIIGVDYLLGPSIWSTTAINGLQTSEGVPLPASSATIANVSIIDPARTNVPAMGRLLTFTLSLAALGPGRMGEVIPLNPNAAGLTQASFWNATTNSTEFIPLTFQPGSLTIVPEPSGLLLLAAVAGCWAIAYGWRTEMKLLSLARPVAALVAIAGNAGFAAPVTQVEFLGKHPDAVSQSTTRGSTLHTLQAAAGEIYMGYGDYNFDTGPITMRYFDTRNDTFSPALVTANTEALHRIKLIGNEVWATTTDPQLFSDGGYIKGPTGGGSWSAVNSLAGLHFFDVASYAGDANHVFLAGSGGPTAIENSFIYETLDGGANWNLVLDLPVPSGAPPGAFTRFYGIGELNGKLYVQHTQLGGGFVPLAMYTYDGTSWTTQPSPTTANGETIFFLDPDTFAGKVIVRDRHAGITEEPTFVFDGSSLTEIQVAGTNGQLTYWDQYVDGDTLYLLTNEFTVIATQDLQTWSVVAADLPSTVRSLAVSGASLYFGATDASLYRVAVPEPSSILMLLIVCLGIRAGKMFNSQ